MINTYPDQNATTAKRVKILIGGAGIAGLTQAFWLDEFGFDLAMIERSAELRDGGYMIDFSAEDKRR